MKKIALSLALFLIHAPLFSSTFHAVVIADTAAADVRPSATVDIKKMSLALKQIAKASKQKLSLTVLSGKKATSTALGNWFHKSRVKSHDTLLFYFTGHGFASTTQPTIWPNMFFKTKKETLSMESVHQALKQKKARLTILLSDSCNKFGNTPIFHRALSKQPKVKISFSAKKRGLNKLFRKNRGRILASGAVRGTSSYGSNYGGFFTQALLLSLQDESHTSKPSWKRVFQKVNKLLRHAQQPQHKLYLQHK